jgi:hypothetical protein
VNHLSAVKRRSPRRVAHSKTTQNPLGSMEKDGDSSHADSRNDDLLLTILITVKENLSHLIRRRKVGKRKRKMK